MVAFQNTKVLGGSSAYSILYPLRQALRSSRLKPLDYWNVHPKPTVKPLLTTAPMYSWQHAPTHRIFRLPRSRGNYSRWSPKSFVWTSPIDRQQPKSIVWTIPIVKTFAEINFLHNSNQQSLMSITDTYDVVYWDRNCSGCIMFTSYALTCAYSDHHFLFFNRHFCFPAQIVGGFTLSDRLDKPWSQVGVVPSLPRYVPSFFYCA